MRVAVIQTLQDAGATIRACDPEDMDHAARLAGNVDFCDGVDQVVEGSDALTIVIERDAFRALDRRNIHPRDMVEAAGFSYTAVGR